MRRSIRSNGRSLGDIHSSEIHSKRKDSDRIFLENLGKKLGFDGMDDWHHIKLEDISRNGGNRLLKRYKNSPLLMLRSIYPEFSWNILLMNPKPRGFWMDKDNCRVFL